MQQNYNQMAQGLASLGRGDDSMLMHITPDEFQDFNRMAQSAGMEHIPINPMTGLPEFGFGKSFKRAFKSVKKTVSKVLKSPIVRTLAPIAIGMYAPGFFPAGSFFNSAVGIGALTGGATWALTGDPMAGLSAGLGAYGGANLGQTMGNYATKPGAGGWTPGATASGVGNAAGNVPSHLVSNAATSPLASSSLGGISDFSLDAGLSRMGEINQGIGDLTTDFFNSPSNAWEQLKTASGEYVTKPGTEATPETVTGLERNAAGDIVRTTSTPAQAATEASTVFKPGTGYDAAWTVGAPAYQVAMAAMAPDPEDIEDQLTDEEIDKLEGTDYDPTRRLDLTGDSGLRLMAGSPGLDTSTAGALDLVDEEDEEETGITYAAQGGLMRLANGGYLSGGNIPGDGMSDDIPARIGGTQEAALSEGEFVIPADVVSHLGNGSSNAGSKKLYAMMDNLRKARTGTEKQGKEINPYNYMPA
jgi:hypothetical protein